MKKIKDYLLFLKQRFYAYRRAVKLDQKIIIAITVMTAAIIIVLAWIIRPNPKIEIAATQLAQTPTTSACFTKPNRDIGGSTPKRSSRIIWKPAAC